MTTLENPPTKAAAATKSAAGLPRPRRRSRDLETTGLAHLPDTGGAVLALTHFGHRELAIVESAVWRRSRRRIRCLVLNGRIDEPRAGRLFRPLRRIFIDTAAGSDAYAEALEALRHGELVALFPEAGASDSIAVRGLRIGAARLALEADVPLIPVVVWGDRRSEPNQSSPGSARFPDPRALAIGAPIPMQRTEDVRAVTDELRATMQRMVLRLAGAGHLRAGFEDDRCDAWADDGHAPPFPA